MTRKSSLQPRIGARDFHLPPRHARPALFSGNATFSWQPDSLLSSRSLPGGTSETFSYDGAKRPTAAQVTAGGATLATLTSAYDRVSDRTSDGQTLAGVSGPAGSSTLTFTYDPLRRVTGYSCSACSPSSVSYTYDADSNRLSAGAVGYTYNPDDSLATQTQGGTTHDFAYDAAGNMTSSAVSFNQNTSYTYDAANNLTHAAAPGQPAVSYTLDALGRRLTRDDGTASATYTYGGEGETIDRVASGPSTLDSAVDSMGDRLTVGASWTLPTFRGDVMGLLNPAASAFTDAYRYDPYGQLLATSGTTANPWRFQGRLVEPTTGEYDFGSRQYDPGAGAFTSLDTVLGQAANPLTLNRYLYAVANPESMVDPDGHIPMLHPDAGVVDTSVQAEIARAESSVEIALLQAVEHASNASHDALLASIEAMAAASAKDRATIAARDAANAKTEKEYKSAIARASAAAADAAIHAGRAASWAAAATREAALAGQAAARATAAAATLARLRGPKGSHGPAGDAAARAAAAAAAASAAGAAASAATASAASRGALAKVAKAWAAAPHPPSHSGNPITDALGDFAFRLLNPGGEVPPENVVLGGPVYVFGPVEEPGVGADGDALGAGEDASTTWSDALPPAASRMRRSATSPR